MPRQAELLRPRIERGSRKGPRSIDASEGARLRVGATRPGEPKRHSGKPQDRNAPSDGYATGLVLYVLRQAGVPATERPIQRGVAWLKANQRESGRWFTRSLNRDSRHYISNAGTAFAILALQACNTR